MTQDYQTGLPSDPDGSTTQTAKDQAAGVAQSAAQSSSHMVDEAKAQAGEVGREAGRQAKGVLDQSRTQITQQASEQQRKAAGGLRSFSSELSTMAQASSQPGMATDVVRQVATRADSLASWLDEREPGALVDEVKTFARNNPGTFLLIAAGTGLLAGRLTRGIKDASGGQSSGGAAHRAPGAPSTGGYGFESGAVTGAYGSTYETGSTYGTGAVHGETTSTGTGAAYAAGTTGAYGEGLTGTAGGTPTYGVEEGGYSSATPTTAGSADETQVYATPTTGTGTYSLDQDTYGSGTETLPENTSSYLESEPGVFGGGTTQAPEPEVEQTWPPVHGEGEQR